MDSTPRPGRHAPGASVQSQPVPGSLEAHDRDSDEKAASEHVNVSHAAAWDSSLDADHQYPEPPEHLTARVRSQPGEGSRAADSSSSAHSTKEQRAQQRQAEADRSWDSLLLRFAESSLFKGGPLPSLQVLPWKAPVDDSWHIACALNVRTSLLYSDTSVSILVITRMLLLGQVLHCNAALGGQPVLPPLQPDSPDGLFLGELTRAPSYRLVCLALFSCVLQASAGGVMQLSAKPQVPLRRGWRTSTRRWQMTFTSLWVGVPRFVRPCTCQAASYSHAGCQALHLAIRIGGVSHPLACAAMDGVCAGPDVLTRHSAGDAVWQPVQLEAESARGCWVAVSPPPALRDSQVSGCRLEERRGRVSARSKQWSSARGAADSCKTLARLVIGCGATD